MLSVSPCIFLLVAIILQDQPAKVPSKKEQETVRMELQELYKDAYGEKDSGVLLTEGQNTNDHPTAKYVLLTDARDFAVEAGALDVAFEAGQLLATLFENPDKRWLAKLISRAQKAARTPDRLRRLHAQTVNVARKRVEAEDFDVAGTLAKESSRIAKALRSPLLIEHSKDVVDEVETLSKESGKAKKAGKALETDPDNTAAKLDLGLYQCFRKDLWEEGLLLVANGSDPTLAEAAKAELAKDPVKAGEAWERAGKKKGLSLLEQRRYLGRAIHWLGTAASGASGVTRAKLNSRLAELEALGRVPIDLLLLVDPEKDGVEGNWKRNSKGVTSDMGRNQRIKVPYQPPAEYDLRAEVEKVGGGFSVFFGLPLSGSVALVEFDAYPSGKTSILPGSSKTYEGKVFPEQSTRTIEFFIRKRSLTVKVDGEIILDWVSASFRSASPGRRAVPDHKGLFWGSFQSYYVVRSLELRAVSGKGKRLR